MPLPLDTSRLRNMLRFHPETFILVGGVKLRYCSKIDQIVQSDKINVFELF